MKPILALLLTTAALHAEPVSLFDGKTLDGWDYDPKIWRVEDGMITEGTSNNAWIIKGGKIITRQLSNDILHGITRKAVMRLASEDGLVVEERPFTEAEAMDADEAFVTSATTFVMPVVRINGKGIGNGNPGSVTLRLRELYIEEARRS